MDPQPNLLSDDDLMTYGTHHGKKMGEVPAKYLLWLYDNNRCNGPVFIYVKDNLDKLKERAKNEHS
jgi:uncharacterized protein (DUF3820 family)